MRAVIAQFRKYRFVMARDAERIFVGGAVIGIWKKAGDSRTTEVKPQNGSIIVMDKVETTCVTCCVTTP